MPEKPRPAKRKLLRARSGLLKGLNPTVAIVSMTLVMVFLLFGVLRAETAASVFDAMRDGIIAGLSWFYVMLVALVLGFVIWLALSRHGRIRLGAEGEKPEFGLLSWFAMLFAAGMGIGLVFWSIAEPLTHFQGNPFVAEAGSPQAAQTAMRLTFFHWGLHPWAIYAFVGACFAYFSFRRGLPLTVRSAFHPLLGERIYGPAGHAIDILAIFATTFGVATSLGLGAAQINAGLERLTGLPLSTQSQLAIIAVITLVVMGSVVSGVTRGIRLLSNFNLVLAAALVAFVLLAGPTLYVVELFVQSIGDYLQNVVWLSFWTGAHENTGWQGAWTTFYWGWWISWAPFVGMFIARISRGRTIREFVAGVLLAPTLVTFFWMSVMGGTALGLTLDGETAIAAAVERNVALSLYETIAVLDPGAIGTGFALLATVLVAVFFITSADSGTLVVNTLLSGGDTRPPRIHRLIWGAGIGAIAGALLPAGGLGALQAAAISAALPFALIMVLMAAGLVMSLRKHERAARPKGKTAP
ncbi:MAG: BCCT family transporter [Maricaulaceae bacterium]|nr:BCCT family transporter [Maricaulaceae bacterium]